MFGNLVVDYALHAASSTPKQASQVTCWRMLALLPLLSLALGSSLGTSSPSAQAPSYTAKLGTFYLLGPVARVSGSKETLDLGIQRLVALDSVHTALAFSTTAQTYVAGEGKKLVMFSATIKNPARGPIDVYPSETFGLRVYESGMKAGDVKYLGAVAADTRASVSTKLKQGQSTKVICIYEFPAASPNLRVGIYFDRYNAATIPKFNLDASVAKPKSIFALDALNFSSSATAKRGEAFDFEGLTMKVLECVPLTGGSYAVRMELTNPMLAPGRWGWQYAKAILTDSSGRATDFYPDFFVAPESSDWRNEIAPGQTVRGEYRFFPASPGSPVSMTLTMHASKRSVKVNGLSRESAPGG